MLRRCFADQIIADIRENVYKTSYEGMSRSSFQSSWPELRRRFSSRELIMADMGIVEPDKLLRTGDVLHIVSRSPNGSMSYDVNVLRSILFLESYLRNFSDGYPRVVDQWDDEINYSAYTIVSKAA